MWTKLQKLVQQGVVSNPAGQIHFSKDPQFCNYLVFLLGGYFSKRDTGVPNYTLYLSSFIFSLKQFN
jgi:hypothetical protein